MAKPRLIYTVVGENNTQDEHTLAKFTAQGDAFVFASDKIKSPMFRSGIITVKKGRKTVSQMTGPSFSGTWRKRKNPTSTCKGCSREIAGAVRSGNCSNCGTFNRI